MDLILNGFVVVMATVGVASIVLFAFVFSAPKEDEDQEQDPIAKFEIQWRSGVSTFIYIQYQTEQDLLKIAYTILKLDNRGGEVDSVKQAVLMHRNWPRHEDLEILSLV